MAKNKPVRYKYRPFQLYVSGRKCVFYKLSIMEHTNITIAKLVEAGYLGKPNKLVFRRYKHATDKSCFYILISEKALEKYDDYITEELKKILNVLDKYFLERDYLLDEREEIIEDK